MVGDLRFHKVLQTAIITQTTKENEEIEKMEKYCQKPLELCTNLCVSVCVCERERERERGERESVLAIASFYCVWTYKWCLVYGYVQIHTQRDIREVVFQIGERHYVAKFAPGRPRKTSSK